MAYPRFVAYDLLGVFIWAPLIATLGYFFGKEWERIGPGYRWYSGLFLITLVAMGIGYILLKFLRRRRQGPATSLVTPEA